MNRTNFTHALWALLMQAAIGIPTGDWYAGALLAGGFFVAREHAQEQVDIKIRTGVAVPAQNPFDGFLWRDIDRILDAVFPVVAVTVVWAFKRFA